MLFSVSWLHVLKVVVYFLFHSLFETLYHFRKFPTQVGVFKITAIPRCCRHLASSFFPVQPAIFPIKAEYNLADSSAK